MTWYIGTLIFSDWCMIRRWASFPLFSMFCILLGWVGEVTISYVGLPRKEDLLRSNLFTKFSLPTLTEMSHYRK